jgi:hypothetical protein
VGRAEDWRAFLLRQPVHAPAVTVSATSAIYITKAIAHGCKMECFAEPEENLKDSRLLLWLFDPDKRKNMGPWLRGKKLLR